MTIKSQFVQILGKKFKKLIKIHQKITLFSPVIFHGNYCNYKNISYSDMINTPKLSHVIAAKNKYKQLTQIL